MAHVAAFDDVASSLERDCDERRRAFRQGLVHDEAKVAFDVAAKAHLRFGLGHHRSAGVEPARQTAVGIVFAHQALEVKLGAFVVHRHGRLVAAEVELRELSAYRAIGRQVGE